MLTKPLQFLDFVRPDAELSPGLIPVHGSNAQRQNLSVDERAAILEAESFNRVDFVFFRRFTDGRSSQIAAYVVDNGNEQLSRASLADLHRQVWLQGRAPLLYVAWPSCIDVLACARGPEFWNERRGDYQYKPAKVFELKALEIAAEVSREMQKFSAMRLADGTLWEDPDNAKLANHNKAAHQQLIQSVVDADAALNGKKNPLMRRLLLLTVLVKYLEDRGVFPNDGWFGRYHKGAKSFFDVLKGGQPEEVNKLLSFLKGKFNGDIFDLSDVCQERLTAETLQTFAQLVEAKTLNRQRYLWEQYSFEHLPVEVISHLYQRFVEGGHGAVYTPAFLAGLLLDHAMPYDNLTGHERILDPACGSGVFLVGAFRRLVNAWRNQHGWKRPEVENLKRILRESIFGVDLDGNAVDLTVFSLSLAICDALKPEVIWNELTFDPLRGSNLLEADFFRLCLDARNDSSAMLSKHFDVVLGNPPFESKLTPAAKQIDDIAGQEENDRGAIPDKQIAYLFLEQIPPFLEAAAGRVCMIQPAALLYNWNVDTFRTNLLKKCQVETILDFASIRGLYAKDTKTVAVFARGKRPSTDHTIAHWTFRRTVSVKERICFELDHYDYHVVPQKQAENTRYIWRANLLGGGRLESISQRLRDMRTLGEYLQKNVQERCWDYGEGFIAAKTGRREPAPFLTGKPLLPTEAFTEAGIDEEKIGTVTETHFRSAYTEDRYRPPLVLIKENDSLPIAFWDKGFLAYRDKIVGVHAPGSQAAELRSLYQMLQAKRDIYRFSCLLNGSQSLIGKATAILKQDIDVLPFPEDEDLSFCFWEEILRQDVLMYMTDFVRLGHNSRLLQYAAEMDDLHRYSETLVRMLVSVYTNIQAGNPVLLNGLACQPFYFGERSNLSWLSGEDAESSLRDLIYDKGRERLQTIRVFRLYLDNAMLVVKPDRLRYWIRSTAIRDADETLVDLREQGY
jgi:hypothetical protein